MDCVAFFKEEGKGGKNFRKKTLLDKKWRGSREMPVETKRYQRYEGLSQVHDIHKWWSWWLAWKIKIVTIQLIKSRNRYMIDRQISTSPRFRSVGFSFPRYSEKSFINIYRALYGDTVCMLPFRGATTRQPTETPVIECFH